MSSTASRAVLGPDGYRYMSRKSPVQHALDEIVALGPQPLLGALGYRKSRRNFYLEAGGVFRLIGFQASQWGEASSGAFTINLDVKQPYFHEILQGEPPPRSPISMCPILSQRIGMVMPEKRDVWFEVNEASDTASISRRMTELIERFGLPYLEKVGSVDRLLQMFGEGVFPPNLCGGRAAQLILLCYDGQREAAESCLRILQHDPNYAKWEPLLAIANRLDLHPSSA
jgi:hypothetical protein